MGVNVCSDVIVCVGVIVCVDVFVCFGVVFVRFNVVKLMVLLFRVQN